MKYGTHRDAGFAFQFLLEFLRHRLGHREDRVGTVDLEDGLGAGREAGHEDEAGGQRPEVTHAQRRRC
jgi:hypothetical protein